MSLDLPEPIARYFAAEEGSAESVAACFAEDGFVTDEGKTHRGREAIKKWKENASVKYRFTSTPKSIEELSGKAIVVCQVKGTFPGSPIDLRYAFALKANTITSLEIGL